MRGRLLKERAHRFESDQDLAPHLMRGTHRIYRDQDPAFAIPRDDGRCHFLVERQALGYDKLYHYDRYAPLFESKEEYSFDQAKEKKWIRAKGVSCHSLPALRAATASDWTEVHLVLSLIHI